MAQAAPEISVGVVIPAAGSGQRLGGRRKQFRLLGQKPLLIHTVEIFDGHPQVRFIVIAAPPDDVDEVEDLCRTSDLRKVTTVVAGGRTRQESVRAGLDALPADTSIVLTHDAVRPFITATEVSRLIEVVSRSGAGVIAAPVSDTLVRSQSGKAGETVSRQGLYRMLTPQGFRADILRRAHDLASESGAQYTDEVTLVRAAGYDIELVEGSPMNIKITTAADWSLAEWMWPVWESR